MPHLLLFDISQENKYKEGVRFRCWDSCMFSEYTEMAGGHNPRPTKKTALETALCTNLTTLKIATAKCSVLGAEDA